MGCTSSKVDNEEKVARCKARKRFMKHAVASRHQFAASHAAYVQALKNVGAAFRQFGETEIPDTTSSSSTDHDYNPSSPTTPDAKPPPRPLFLPPPSPNDRHGLKLDPASVILEEEELSPDLSPEKKKDHRVKNKKSSGGREVLPPPLPLGSAPPPPPPPKSSAWGFLDPFQEDEATAAVAVAAETFTVSSKSTSGRARAKLWFPAAEKDLEQRSSDNSLAIIVRRSGSKELVDVLRELDELFLRGYQSGKEVGKLLEARKIHYHSNFVENRGFDSHSSKVLNAISWSNWKSPLKRKTEETALAVTDEDFGAHSGTLDRLLVWEKKLYEEMRTAEANRIEYEKKCAQLRHQDSKGDYNESIDKTRNMIKMLQTRIVVALQGVDTAVAAIIKIRDEELYPQLLELEEGLTGMWAELYAVHEKQYAAVSRMRPLDCLLGSVEATSNIHRLATSQLEASLDNWYSCLNKLITSQRDYMRNLCGWVRLCVMPFEDIKDSPTLSAGSSTPPIHDVCLEWHQALDRLPDKVALEAIKSFVAVIHKIVELQNTELQHRKKVESLTKEIDKKVAYIQNYEKKHPDSASTTTATASDHHHHSNHLDETDELTVLHDILPPKSPLADRRAAVDLLRRKLEEEKEQVSKAVYDTRAMTLNSLHTGLPSVFQSVAGFASVCSQAFQLLYHNARVNKEEARNLLLIVGPPDSKVVVKAVSIPPLGDPVTDGREETSFHEIAAAYDPATLPRRCTSLDSRLLPSRVKVVWDMRLSAKDLLWYKGHWPVVMPLSKPHYHASSCALRQAKWRSLQGCSKNLRAC
ncbi:hypothetical protein SELMODRAFT_425043 [Selaginella moellendorffii]|uniref:DUF632 domain-containing protein n=1 Tax=Selaginella moellendorffii TaxID=88036 RepID=D8SRU8_SELML|nr:hypothetical protein SELMODRAFT_425043 [Selaginella moellendorffii]